MINITINRQKVDFFNFSSNEYYYKNFSKAWQNWEMLRMEERKETSKRGLSKKA